MILISEQRVKILEAQERFKLAVLSSDPSFWLSKLFPEVSPQKEDGEIEEGDPGIEWVFPQITEEDAKKLLEEFREQQGGKLSLDEIEEHDWV